MSEQQPNGTRGNPISDFIRKVDPHILGLLILVLGMGWFLVRGQENLSEDNQDRLAHIMTAAGAGAIALAQSSKGD